MKKLLILFLLLGNLLCGCSGLVDSSTDRKHRYKQIADLNWRMAMDDLDYFLLFDRSSSLTQYHPHLGK